MCYVYTIEDKRKNECEYLLVQMIHFVAVGTCGWPNVGRGTLIYTAKTYKASRPRIGTQTFCLHTFCHSTLHFNQIG